MQMPTFINLCFLLLLLLPLTVSSFSKSYHHLHPHEVGGFLQDSTTTTTTNITTALYRKRIGVAREFVSIHNNVRSLFLVPPIKWDKTLALHARRWAIRRAASDCNVQNHSGGPYGENQFWGLREHWTPRRVVLDWASEVSFYNATSNQCLLDQSCGHFTQVVWRSTQRIGCAKVQCQCSKQGWFIVCEYDPPGNEWGYTPFE